MVLSMHKLLFKGVKQGKKEKKKVFVCTHKTVMNMYEFCKHKLRAKTICLQNICINVFQ